MLTKRPISWPCLFHICSYLIWLFNFFVAFTVHIFEFRASLAEPPGPRWAASGSLTQPCKGQLALRAHRLWLVGDEPRPSEECDSNRFKHGTFIYIIQIIQTWYVPKSKMENKKMYTHGENRLQQTSTSGATCRRFCRQERELPFKASNIFGSW